MEKYRPLESLKIREWLSESDPSDSNSISVEVSEHPVGKDLESTVDIVLTSETGGVRYSFNLYDSKDFDVPLEYIRSIRTTLRLLMSRLKMVRDYMEEKEKEPKENV